MRKAELRIGDHPLEVDIGEYNDHHDDPSSPYISFINGSDSQLSRTASESSSSITQTGASFVPSSPAASPSPSSGSNDTPPVPSTIPAYLKNLSSHRSFTGLRQLVLSSASSPALSRLPARNGSGALGLDTHAKLMKPTTHTKSSLSEKKLVPGRTSEIDSLEMDLEAMEKLRRWILCLVVVNFDLDQGPIIDGVFPPLFLLPAESENIAFSAFPDSPQFEQGSQVHSFRIREQSQSLPSEHSKRQLTKDGFIYGYSHFTQRRDSSLRRGYYQRSTVILTHLQYPAFFTRLVSIFGPLYDLHGLAMLESACHNISTWCDPTPGRTMELGFLGTALYLEIPNTLDDQQLTETSSFQEKYDPRLHILASSSPLLPPPIRLFQSCLAQLWSIWECLLLCEPILIVGSSPTQTSQAVWWFRDIMRPIPLAGDIRPYFTVQDGDHALLANKLPPKAGILLGVTNPFFEKSCSHWPHVLRLERPPGGYPAAGDASPGLGSTRSAATASGWKTKTHKRYISKDRILLKQLEVACKGNEQAQLDASLTLRRHFCLRTRDFLAPLSRYLHTLIPSPAELTNARDTENMRMKPFNSEHFLASLKANGSTLPFKSSRQRTQFYERWLKAPAFGLWLGQQEQIVHMVLRSIRR
ncbi:hypothetical protein APHAL10511_007831 [Amanita phalloides]|nr:hypothetical protein APHAL10511_007831 [Amanita phalloides]